MGLSRRQLHKNAASNIEQVLAVTPHEAPTIRPPASHQKTIQIRRTRHAGHCWRSRDELISDVLLWTPTYGRAKAGRPARTYIQQLCEDTGCSPEDLPEAMNDREKWRKRVRDIRACGTTWRWWWWLLWAPELEPHYRMLFNVISRMPILKEKVSSLCRGCCRNILSHIASVFILFSFLFFLLFFFFFFFLFIEF